MPAGVAQPPGEVDLVGVDEEVGVEVADLLGRARAARAAPPTGTSRPRARACRVLCTVSRRCRNSAPASAVSGDGKRHADAWREPSGRSSARAGAGGCGLLLQRLESASVAPGSSSESSFSSSAIAPARAAQQLGVVSALPRRSLERDHLVHRRVRARGLGGAVARAVVEHQHLARERQARALARDRVEAAQQQLALGGVDDAVSSARSLRRVARAYCLRAMRVHVVDPSAYTPPYDHALCRALRLGRGRGRAVHEPLRLGPVAAPEGYRRRELFYRRARFAPGSPRAARGQARRARPRHAALPPRRARGRRRALPVADRPASRRPPAAARAPAGADRPRRPAARAAPRPAARRSGACTGASTRSSCTPSTVARVCGELGVDPSACT